MSDKYPRTFHLPWSPGASDDDKILKDVKYLLDTPLVITAKIDGGNCMLNRTSIFAR